LRDVAARLIKRDGTPADRWALIESVQVEPKE